MEQAKNKIIVSALEDKLKEKAMQVYQQKLPGFEGTEYEQMAKLQA